MCVDSYIQYSYIDLYSSLSKFSVGGWDNPGCEISNAGDRKKRNNMRFDLFERKRISRVRRMCSRNKYPVTRMAHQSEQELNICIWLHFVLLSNSQHFFSGYTYSLLIFKKKEYILISLYLLNYYYYCNNQIAV